METEQTSAVVPLATFALRLSARIAAANVWAATLFLAVDMKLTKKISICAMLASLGVVILYIGSLVELLDISVACIASFIILFCVAELGYACSFSVYAVISILSFLILPNKWVAAYFAFFFGIMPITKKIYEKTGKIISWILKLLTFNAELFAFYFIFSALDFFEKTEFIGIMLIAALIMLNIVFVLVDIVYGRFRAIYDVRFGHRIRKFLK